MQNIPMWVYTELGFFCANILIFNLNTCPLAV